MTPQYRKGIRVKIVFDEEKIRREQELDLDKIDAFIEKAFADRGFRREGNLYIGSGSPSDFGLAGSLCLSIGEADWLLNNLLEWRWYNGKNEEDFWQIAKP